METSGAQLPPNEGEWKRKYEELYERLNRAEEENKKMKRVYEEENKKWDYKIQECKTHKEKLSHGFLYPGIGHLHFSISSL